MMIESTSSNPSPVGRKSSAFVTTHWTKVLESSGESNDAKAALSDLCEAYYGPVHSFVKNWAVNEQEARDLTHDFFASLLEGRPFKQLDRERCRFRSYLLGALKHFLQNTGRAKKRKKRGGDWVGEALSEDHPSKSGLGVALSEQAPEDVVYDKGWAATLMNRALHELEDDYLRAEKKTIFDSLKPWLGGESEELSQKEVARQLGMNEGAIKVAVHRLRKRFRVLIKLEVAQTLDSDEDVKGELNYLVEVLSR